MTKIKLTWLCLCLDISYSFSAIFFFKYIESFNFAKLVLLSSIMQNLKKNWVNRIIITIYCSTFDMWNRSWLLVLRYFHSICIFWKKYFFSISFEDLSKLDMLSRPFYSKAKMQSLLGLWESNLDAKF